LLIVAGEQNRLTGSRIDPIRREEDQLYKSAKETTNSQMG